MGIIVKLHVSCIDSTKDSAEEKEAIDTKLGPILTRLWAYSCNLTKGKKVNCMAWNKSNQVMFTR